MARCRDCRDGQVEVIEWRFYDGNRRPAGIKYRACGTCGGTGKR